MHVNYIISLQSAAQRREHIKHQFTHHNIPFEFYDALYPSQHLNQLIDIYLPNLKNALLSEGEKACFMSHYMLWKKCIDENLPYIFIFEDDVLLGYNAHSFLAEKEWIESRFNNRKFILRLETFLKPSQYKSTNIEQYCNREFLQLVGPQYGMAGYVISLDSIKQLIEVIQTLSPEHLYPIDDIVFDTHLNYCEIHSYQLNPAIAIQELQLLKSKSKLNSQLEKNRKERQKNNKKIEKRTLIQKIKRAITKPYRIYKKIQDKKNIIKFQ